MDFAGARRVSALLVAFAATCVALGCSVTAQAQLGSVSPGGLGGPGGPGGGPPSIGVADGIVSNLQTVASGATFTLITPSTQTLSVAVTSATRILLRSDRSATTLADGQLVRVEGLLNRSTKTLTARVITVDDLPRRCERPGVVSALAADGGSFTLLPPPDAQGGPNGPPPSLPVVVTVDTRIIRVSDGAPAALADGQRVVVIGTQTAGSPTITALGIRVDDVVRTQGAVASVTAASATFVLTSAGPGFFPDGTSVLVATTDKTAILRPRGDRGSFSDIKVGAKLAVVGAYDAITQVVTALEIRLR
ncbi:MAG: DUF5666 domain-containing protein [Armatimonadetes bacterium]|nr:DUF5666 domain-containing protein [Armatimonadota bacterium]